MYTSQVWDELCFMFLNLNLESVWFDSGLKTFSSASNTSSGLSTVISADAKIWVASLPSQLINRPALCLSLRSHRGPEKSIWQSALNWPNSVNLSFESQSNAGLENCRPPTLDIVQISQRFNNNNNSKNTNYIEENRLNMLSFIRVCVLLNHDKLGFLATPMKAKSKLLLWHHTLCTQILHWKTLPKQIKSIWDKRISYALPFSGIHKSKFEFYEI